MHIPTNRKLAEIASSQPLVAADRLAEYSFGLPLPAFIDQPGLYEFRVFANDAYVGRAKFLARPTVEQEGE